MLDSGIKSFQSTALTTLQALARCFTENARVLQQNKVQEKFLEHTFQEKLDKALKRAQENSDTIRELKEELNTYDRAPRHGRAHVYISDNICALRCVPSYARVSVAILPEKDTTLSCFITNRVHGNPPVRMRSGAYEWPNLPRGVRKLIKRHAHLHTRPRTCLSCPRHSYPSSPHIYRWRFDYAGVGEASSSHGGETGRGDERELGTSKS